MASKAEKNLEGTLSKGDGGMIAAFPKQQGPSTPAKRTELPPSQGTSKTMEENADEAQDVVQVHKVV